MQSRIFRALFGAQMKVPRRWEPGRPSIPLDDLNTPNSVQNVHRVRKALEIVKGFRTPRIWLEEWRISQCDSAVMRSGFVTLKTARSFHLLQTSFVIH